METKALFNPETDVLRISKKNYESKNSFLATIILKKFGTLTLSSLGFTSEKVIKTASKLEQKGYATITSIVSGETENKRGHPIVTFEVKLQKTKEFDNLIKDKLK